MVAFAPPDTVRLKAALILMGLLLVGGLVFSSRVKATNEANAGRLLVVPLRAKNQGTWLQRRAFADDTLLPVYGTSELTMVVKNRADEFFQNAPTGFRVCPVGGPGNTTLLIAEKLAALGEDLRGRKIVIMLSGSWFTRPGVSLENYAGNFSPLHAIGLLEDTKLPGEVSHRLAARMAEFPSTLADQPALRISLESLQEEGTWPHLKRAILSPAVAFQKTRLEMEDAVTTSFSISELTTKRQRRAPSQPVIPWDTLIAHAEGGSSAPASTHEMGLFHDDPDGHFLTAVNASCEWGDLALLLDVLRCHGVDALIISTPLDGRHFDEMGVARKTRDAFYHRFETLCAVHGYLCEDFAAHDLDAEFLCPGSSHYSPRGWLHVDRLLDDFYHRRNRTTFASNDATEPALEVEE